MTQPIPTLIVNLISVAAGILGIAGGLGIARIISMYNQKKGRSKVIFEVVSNIEEVYKQVNEDAKHILQKAQYLANSDLQTQVKKMQDDANTVVDENRKRITTLLDELTKHSAEIGAATKVSLCKFQEELDTDLQTAQKQLYQELYKFLSSSKEIQKTELEKMQTAQTMATEIVDNARSSANKIREQAASMMEKVTGEKDTIINVAKTHADQILTTAGASAQTIVETAQKGFDGYLDELKTRLDKGIEAGNQAIATSVQQSADKALADIRQIVNSANDKSWEKIDDFNKQLLNKFEEVSDSIINQSEDRARRIGEKVLKQVENEIVLYVISVVKESLNLTLSPEQHQEVIMDAVAKLKKQLKAPAKQEGTAEIPATTPAANPPLVKVEGLEPNMNKLASQTVPMPVNPADFPLKDELKASPANAAAITPPAIPVTVPQPPASTPSQPTAVLPPAAQLPLATTTVPSAIVQTSPSPPLSPTK